MESPGPTRFIMRCDICGPTSDVAYETQAMADDKLELHMAFVHYQGGCASAFYILSLPEEK